MKDIVDAAVHISHPLALAGLFAAILFGILQQTLKRKPDKKLQWMIVIGLFFLSLVAMCLGFAAWYVGAKRLSFNLFFEGRPMSNATVSITNLNVAREVTNEDGNVSFDVGRSELPASLHLRVLPAQSPYEIDTSFAKDSIPADIYLSKVNITALASGNTVNMKLIIFYNGVLQPGVQVKAPAHGIEETTDPYGAAVLRFTPGLKEDSLTLSFVADKPAIQLDTNIAISNEPVIIRLQKTASPPPPPVVKTFSTTETDQAVVDRLRQLTGARLEAGSRNLVEIGYDPAALSYASSSKTWTFSGSPVLVFVNHQVCATIPGLHIDALDPSLDPDRLKRYGHDKAVELFKGANLSALQRIGGCLR